MKLYTSRLAPNPRRVLWFLAEKGIADLEIVEIDLLAGTQKSPAYLAEVGLPVCPALILDDGAALTESLAICRYLEALYPEPSLFGNDAKGAALIEMWTRRAELMVAHPLMLGVRHGHPALAALETQIPAISETSLVQARRALTVFERRLGDSEFIADDRPTMADGVLFTGLEFARMVRFKIDETTPNLLRWQGELRARPSAQAGA